MPTTTATTAITTASAYERQNLRRRNADSTNFFIAVYFSINASYCSAVSRAPTSSGADILIFIIQPSP